MPVRARWVGDRDGDRVRDGIRDRVEFVYRALAF
jgi:hypothetical protein